MKIKLLKFQITKRFGICVFIICIFSCFACHNDAEKILDNHQDGIAPQSIDNVVDVFELKYGAVKDTVYDGQAFKFSIIDVKDSLQRCDVIYSPDPNFLNGIRINAYLRMEIQGTDLQLKVSSKKCGPFFSFKNDGTDIQQIWDMLNTWQADPKSVYESNFESAFNSDLGEGTLITNTSFSIYMASAYPVLSEQPENISLNMYKFIFIITKQKAK